MADNKGKTGKADRSRVAGLQGYEVDVLVDKFGITRAQAKKAIESVATRSRVGIEAYIREHYKKK